MIKDLRVSALFMAEESGGITDVGQHAGIQDVKADDALKHFTQWMAPILEAVKGCPREEVLKAFVRCCIIGRGHEVKSEGRTHCPLRGARDVRGSL